MKKIHKVTITTDTWCLSIKGPNKKKVIQKAKALLELGNVPGIISELETITAAPAAQTTTT